MKIGHEKNEYGTLVTRFQCETCGNEFTVCPAVTPDKEKNWKGCLSEECESYDPERDVEKIINSCSSTVIKKRKVRHLNSKPNKKENNE